MFHISNHRPQNRHWITTSDLQGKNEQNPFRMIQAGYFPKQQPPGSCLQNKGKPTVPKCLKQRAGQAAALFKPKEAKPRATPNPETLNPEALASVSGLLSHSMGHSMAQDSEVLRPSCTTSRFLGVGICLGFRGLGFWGLGFGAWV